jgi:hypothetical protein
MDRLRRICAALALVSAAAAFAAGCGGEKTDVSGGVDNLNERLTQQGIPAKLNCPKEVDGGEGTKFECTLKANEGGKEEKIQMEVQKEGDDLVVDVQDQQAFEKSLAAVAAQGGGQQQQQGGGEQPQGGGAAPPAEGQGE